MRLRSPTILSALVQSIEWLYLRFISGYMTKAIFNKRDKDPISSMTSRRRVAGEQGAVSLESFAQKKGHVRALEEFHKRKQRKRSETAKALRRYRRVMKREGYEAGKGASRKRRETEDHSTTNLCDSELTDRPTNEKRKKSNPLYKSLQKVEQNKNKLEALRTKKEGNERERLKRIRERKQQSKLLAKRTKKGQPVMKHMVNNLLLKLTKK